MLQVVGRGRVWALSGSSASSPASFVVARRSSSESGGSKFTASTRVVGPGSWGRRSTIDVPPNFSEAPHLRSFIPHPKTDFSKNHIASR